MSLEARIELLTAAVIELTAAIGAMQAPGPVVTREVHGDMRGNQIRHVEEVPNDPTKSSPSGEQSAPTGELSSPEPTPLDYAKDVKPITIRLSKEKGRETTIAVLQRFGVKGAQELDAAQWGEYIAHCEKVLAGGEV